MKFVVTGATGFVGSAMAKALLNLGAEVLALSRTSNAPAQLKSLPITWVVADITEPRTLSGHFANADYVIHAAGKLGKAGTTEDEYMRLHVDGTKNLLNELSKSNPKPKTLYISSPGVLGPITGEAANEETPLAPSNPYERSKAVAEDLVKGFAANGFPVVIGRPEFIYGPGDMHVLGLFRAIQKGHFFYIGGGQNTCHPTFIDDATDGLLRCLKHGQVGEVYHITGPRPVTFREFSETIACALNVSPPRFNIPRSLAMVGASGLEILGRFAGKSPPLSRTGVAFFSEDRRFSWSKAQRELDYQPQYSLQAGVEITINWYQRNGYL